MSGAESATGVSEGGELVGRSDKALLMGGRAEAPSMRGLPGLVEGAAAAIA
jgi:hypothetical protein